MAIFSFKISQLFLRAVLMMRQRKLNAVKTRSGSEALVRRREGARLGAMLGWQLLAILVGGWMEYCGGER
ncbi:hypothetical protein HLI17_24285 [Rhizobium laguerreae]|uniref:Uncharacterized protein n=1 Tax=Rhizobium laguerreae TaxID=1076926 RepID=A0A7Y2R8J0_9HYPH|nr:hypothetical protein [Rhizobium laguerreae]